MWERYFTAASVKDALKILEDDGSSAKLIAGGTDIVLELKKGAHPEIKTLVDINRVEGLNTITEKDDQIVIGPLVTHNQCLISDLLIQSGIPLVKAAYSVGAPQIRNVGTIIGNLVTASPANDTITPLLALDAGLTIRSSEGERKVKLTDFYQGVRKTSLKQNEIVIDVHFKKMAANQKGSFIKYLLRQSHAISVANAAAVLTFDHEIITDARITLGSVAPTVIHAESAEKFLIGKKLNKTNIEEAARLAINDSHPITDVRASEEYRSHLVYILTEKVLSDILDGSWNEFDEEPVLLWGNKKEFFTPIKKTIMHDRNESVQTRINGKEYALEKGQNKPLSKTIRDVAGLTGTKIGCGEGECGACTLYMNGLPVFSCLIPTPRAHDCDITTIEGISDGEELHPVQKAFIDKGAIQCGFCTPGFIMSSVKLIEEKPHPSEQEIKQGLAGNICRCTGYYSIISAVEKAAEEISSK